VFERHLRGLLGLSDTGSARRPGDVDVVTASKRGPSERVIDDRGKRSGREQGPLGPLFAFRAEGASAALRSECCFAQQPGGGSISRL